MVFGKGKQTNMKEISTNAAKAKHKKCSQKGEDNPNWKDGISKDNYHYKKIQKQRYPERIKARESVMRALRRGKLIKPDICENCEIWTLNLEAHHKDYTQPLKVEWLCKTCHRDEHSER